MPRSTDECKQFLVNLFSNPVYHGFGGQHDQLKKWKRIHKCRPGTGDYERHVYEIWFIDADNKLNTIQRPYTDFVAERGFRYDEATYDEEVQFLVLEDAEGNLFLGDDIGD